MLAISIIFTLVVELSILPFISGIDDAIIYVIKNSKMNEKNKRTMIIIFSIVVLIIYALSLWGFWLISDFLETLNFGGYIKVLIYTLILAILSTNSMYFSPKKHVTSAWIAFKNGFTKANVNNIFSYLPLNVLINLFYLISLIFAQVEDLGYCKLPENYSYFFTLNKYGIVIVVAVQKIIKSIVEDKKRANIMTDAFVIKEKEEEEFINVIKKSISDLKSTLKCKIHARKEAKEQCKKDKENK